MSDFVLNAEVREDSGKGSSRRLRHANLIPAIIYGGTKKQKPQSISIKENEFNKALESESFYSSVVTLNVGGKEEQVVLKDLQRHPAKALIWHADFLRVNKNTVLKTTIPLHFVNEDSCVGVKIGGGSIAHQMSSVEVTCSATNLPEFIEVDVAELNVGDIVHLSDLKLSKGVEITALTHGDEYDSAVVSVNAAKSSSNDDAEGDSAEEAAPESE